MGQEQVERADAYAEAPAKDVSISAMKNCRSEGTLGSTEGKAEESSLDQSRSYI